MSLMNVKIIKNFINGNFHEKIEKFNSYNPSNGSVYALIPDSDANDVQLAAEAALEAFKTWSKTTKVTRAKILNRIADIIEENLDELARLESEDQGKPIWLSKSVDIPRAILNFRHFANCLAYDSDRSIIDNESGIINYVSRQPVGVVGIITPWNLPLYLLTFKLAPAIAFGNTVVAKPSEITSMTAFRLCQLMNDADLPKGVVNMVFGYGHKVGKAIVEHPSIKSISFTGSTATGRRIAQKAAPFFKKLSLEMGGKNAAIIFDDFDNDLMTIAKSTYFNSGQICLASSRLLVHENIYDEFVEKFIEISKQFTIGDPFDKETKLGPLVSRQHLDKVMGYIEMARKMKLVKMNYLEPPKHLNPKGYYCGIAIIYDIEDDHSPLMMEEIFGPVVCITKFKNEYEAIEIANNTIYGLSTTVWTRSLDLMHRVCQQLQSGTVWGNCWLHRNLNMPFGGIKQSGIGYESTEDSKEFYTNKKTICISLNQN